MIKNKIEVVYFLLEKKESKFYVKECCNKE